MMESHPPRIARRCLFDQSIRRRSRFFCYGALTRPMSAIRAAGYICAAITPLSQGVVCAVCIPNSSRPTGNSARGAMGEVFDVAVTPQSSRHLWAWVGEILSADHKRQIWCARLDHGFVVLVRHAEFLTNHRLLRPQF